MTLILTFNIFSYNIDAFIMIKEKRDLEGNEKEIITELL